METIDGLLRDIDLLKAELRSVRTIDKLPYKNFVSYNVSWTAASVNPALGNGTLAGRYTLLGKRCFVNIYLLMGTTTTYGTGIWSFSLPFAVYTGGNNYYMGAAHLRDSGTNNYERRILIGSAQTVITTMMQLDSGTNSNDISATVPFTWANGDSVTLQIDYDIA